MCRYQGNLPSIVLHTNFKVILTVSLDCSRSFREFKGFFSRVLPVENALWGQSMPALILPCPKIHAYESGAGLVIGLANSAATARAHYANCHTAGRLIATNAAVPVAVAVAIVPIVGYCSCCCWNCCCCDCCCCDCCSCLNLTVVWDLWRRTLDHIWLNWQRQRHDKLPS